MASSPSASSASLQRSHGSPTAVHTLKQHVYRTERADQIRVPAGGRAPAVSGALPSEAGSEPVALADAEGEGPGLKEYRTIL